MSEFDHQRSMRCLLPLFLVFKMHDFFPIPRRRDIAPDRPDPSAENTRPPRPTFLFLVNDLF